MPTDPHYPQPIARRQAAFDTWNFASANLPSAPCALHARVEVTAVRLCATDRLRAQAANCARDPAVGNARITLLGGDSHEFV